MSKPKQIATIDAETDPFAHGNIPKPFIWGYYNGAEYRQFYDTVELVNFISDRDEVIYAHNGGKFDFHFLVDYFNVFENILIINNRIASVKIGRCELRDSYSILPVPLRDMKKDVFDYSKLTKANRGRHKAEIETYLRNDCVYLYKHVAAFVAQYGRKITLAGTAMSIWRKMSGEPLPNSDEDYYNAIRPYYYGGRVQCFVKGIINTPFKLYDINSAYPYAMTFNHPYGLEFAATDTDITNIIGADLYAVYATSIGALPFIDESGFVFPNDSEIRLFRCTGWELLAGLEHGLRIVSCINHIHFRYTRNFSDYVEHFYALKSSAPKDSSDRLFAKLMLNSLYGKFGANPDKYKERMIVPIAMGFDGENDGWSFSDQIGDKAIISKPIDENSRRYYNVATSASITGFVRAYLYRAIKSCGEALYCDTDSIACAGKFDSIIGEELGAWGLDGDFTSGAIGGKKMYAFKYANSDGYKTASKGVNITASGIISIASGKTIEYRNAAPTFSLGKETRFITRRISGT